MAKKKQQNTKILGYHDATWSLFKTGQRPISWPFAVRLSKSFPSKSVAEWKNATPKEIRKIFLQLKNAKHLTSEQ